MHFDLIFGKVRGLMFGIRTLEIRKSYLLLLLLIVLEYLLFRNHVLRELVWGYPQHFDQTLYLSGSYFIYEEFLHHDLQSIFSFLRNIPQGILLQCEGALFFLLAGASRFSALTINFLYFVAAQLFVFFTLKSITKKLSIPFIALGLFLMLKTTSNSIGGITDYRLEFVAFSLFVIFLGSVVKSDIFLSRRWSAISAVMASLLILHRFIYFVFIFGTIGMFLIVLLYFYLSGHEEKKRSLLRLRNFIIFGLFLSALTLPVFFLNRSAILDYYVTNNFGPTKYIWAEYVGINNLTDHLLFYPKLFIFYHLWPPVIFLIILIITTILFLMKGRKNPTSEGSYSYKEGFVYLILSCIVPLAILTLITSKQSGLPNVFVAPVFWLFILLFIYLSREKDDDDSHVFKPMIALFILLAGLCCYGYNFAMHQRSFYERRDRQQVVRMYEEIGQYCYNAQIDKPFISYDYIVDYYTPKLLDIIYYEKTGVYIKANSWCSIFSLSESRVLRGLNTSDIVIFNPNGFSDSKNSVFPFDREIQKFKPLFETRIKKMTKLGSYSIFGNDIYAYAKLHFTVEGVSGDWLLPEETYLVIPNDVAKKLSAVVIFGPSYPQYVKDLELIAENSNRDSDAKIISRIIMDDSKYLIYCAWSEYKSTAEGPLKIRLKFNKYFIPKTLGINEDTRKLVLWAPQEREALFDLREIIYPSDQNYICGIYGDGFVGPSGITFVLVPGRNTVARKLTITVNVPLPRNSSLVSMPLEIFLCGQAITEKNLKKGANNLKIEIPDSLRTSKLLEVQIKPKFYFIPCETSDSNDTRKLSFVFNKAAITN